MEWKVGEYKKAWRPYEQKIILNMTELLGLSFRQNILDVYIAPWFHAFSDPLVIGVTKEPDLFVDILTHELFHRLLTDNTAVPYETNMLTEWRRLFGEDHDGSSYPNPASHTNQVHTFLAVGGGISQEQNLEVGETIHVEKIPFKTAIEEMSKPDSVYPAIYITALFHAMNFIKSSDAPALRYLKKYV